MAGHRHTKVALITGGAGGIGAATARLLAKHGYDIVVADRDVAAVREIAAEVDGVAVDVDVADREANQAMVTSTVDWFGRLDVLVLCAGVDTRQHGAQPLELDTYRRAVAVNIDGVVLGIDAALPALSEHGGEVVVLASLAGLAPLPTDPVYAMTKSAVIGYVRSMADPLATVGVRINAVSPCFTDTPMLGEARQALIDFGYPLLEPDEVAHAVLGAVDSRATGMVWEVLAGRKPVPHEFTPIATAVAGDGSEISLPPLHEWV